MIMDRIIIYIYISDLKKLEMMFVFFPSLIIFHTNIMVWYEFSLCLTIDYTTTDLQLFPPIMFITKNIVRYIINLIKKICNQTYIQK